jgi:predicted fused transcriptional regulator/phosphomethylpyrimidine kinase
METNNKRAFMNIKYEKNTEDEPEDKAINVSITLVKWGGGVY